MTRVPTYPLVSACGSTRRQSIEGQIQEMLELRRLDRERGLTPRESERLGMLVYREQQRARYRPARIQRLRAELALLEALEIADKGQDALPQEIPEIDMVPGADGGWHASERHAA